MAKGGEMKRWMSFGSIMFALAIIRQYSSGFYYTWATIRRYFPLEIRRVIEQLYTSRLITLFYPYIHITIHEINQSQFGRNQAYYAVEAYLSSFSGKTATKLKAEMQNKNNLVVSMGEHETVTDEYRGVEVWWDSRKVVRSTGFTSSGHSQDSVRRYYSLTFHRRHREMILESYLEHVIEEGNELELRNRQRKLYTNNSDARTYSSQMWEHIAFEHPSTFETMAMDSKKKQEIIEDLLTFRESKDYYARIGNTWKRGYLLYGPPGTGKSTMIAAMANLLNYDVYDLELTTMKDNTVLRQLLTNTTSKSIIVIEDIDCSLHLTGQRKKPAKHLGDGGGKFSAVKKPSSANPEEESAGSKVTLSGLLNFIDGLWSACGGERIIVFTTNHVDKLDPALTRRGRMDKHIELSYCSFEGFKVVAKNYLELETHPMFEEIEELMEVTKITPADVAENLMPKSKIKDAEVCLSSLVEALKKAREESERGRREESERGGRK